MKRNFLIILLFLNVSCMNRFIFNSVNDLKDKKSGQIVYSDDLGRSYEQYSIKEKKWARSIVSLIHEDRYDFSNNLYSKKNETIKFDSNLCESEKYANEVKNGFCSGFLFSRKKLITASHCIPDEKACRNTLIITHRLNMRDSAFKSEQVYHCARLIKSEKDLAHDYALAELNRDVDQDDFLSLNLNQSDVLKGQEITMLGYPLGIGQISFKGNVKYLGSDYILANITSFHGSSGSPVIDTKSEKAIGILTSGDGDFTFNKEKNCHEYKKCTADICNGEFVFRLDRIPVEYRNWLSL